MAVRFSPSAMSAPSGPSPAGPSMVPLDQAIPALLARLADVAAALDGAPAPYPPPGFHPVPDSPPSRRERALLVHFAWTAYTVLAGRSPAEQVPADWPFRLSAVVPLTQRRPDVLPALARLIDRVLTAPPLAPLPSPAGFEELLRRAAARNGTRHVTTPPGGVAARAESVGEPPEVVVAIDFSPSTPDAPHAVVARLELLAAVLASTDDGAPVTRRRGLFRLGWTGWERLYGEAPYDSEHPYVLRLDDPSTLRVPRLVPLDPPAGLVPLLSRLLDQRAAAQGPTIAEVRAELARCRPSVERDVTRASPDAAALAQATAAEAARALDALARQGVIAPGPGAHMARSLDERLAVASLAWSVYRAATGEVPILVAGEETGAYRPLAARATATPDTLAAAVDATLAPESPGAVPGLATWLAVAMAAVEPGDAETGSPELSERADAASRAGAPTAAPARRRIRVLPDHLTETGRQPPTAAWWIGGAAAVATLVTAWRLSGGP